MMPMGMEIRNLCYLVAAVFFILGLKGLSHPRSARRGNLMGALGMLLAVVTTLVSETKLGWGLVIPGLVIGSVTGTLLALKLQMTALPQLVALFNGFGGGASVLVAGAALAAGGQRILMVNNLSSQMLISTLGAVIIGAITFWGSLVAYGKLGGILPKNLMFEKQKILNGLLAGGCFLCAFLVVLSRGDLGWFALTVLLACVLGVLLVMPIGRADMPVVIAILNAYSGLAASGTGFVLNNTVLIISGALVGASGLILTRIMCRAMNRSFKDVMFGVDPGSSQPRVGAEFYEGRIKETSADEAAMVLDAARQVAIVPGYGMAVARAQHAVRELSEILESREINVRFAIHPVAGRMPGHMNVVLAGADIPYDNLNDLETANAIIELVDVAIIIGANDVVNPDARRNPDSPLAGMPILNVDKSKTVIVIKRSLNPGFSGIPNPLFVMDNTLMLFGDGKDMVLAITASLKENL